VPILLRRRPTPPQQPYWVITSLAPSRLHVVLTISASSSISKPDAVTSAPIARTVAGGGDRHEEDTAASRTKGGGRWRTCRSCGLRSSFRSNRPRR
jgi:hypothetical protein